MLNVENVGDCFEEMKLKCEFLEPLHNITIPLVCTAVKTNVIIDPRVETGMLGMFDKRGRNVKTQNIRDYRLMDKLVKNG